MPAPGTRAFKDTFRDVRYRKCSSQPATRMSTQPDVGPAEEATTHPNPNLGLEGGARTPTTVYNAHLETQAGPTDPGMLGGAAGSDRSLVPNSTTTVPGTIDVEGMPGGTSISSSPNVATPTEMPPAEETEAHASTNNAATSENIPVTSMPSQTEPGAENTYDDSDAAPPSASAAAPPVGRSLSNGSEFVGREYSKAGPFGALWVYYDYVRWLWIATDGERLERTQKQDCVVDRVKVNMETAKSVSALSSGSKWGQGGAAQ